MRYVTFSEKEQSQYDIALLVPTLNTEEMSRHYVDKHLSAYKENIIAYDIYKKNKRTPVKDIKAYLDELLPILMNLQTKYLVVCDAEYFKVLTKSRNVEISSGYVLDCVVGDFKVVYCPNYRAVFYDPEKVIAKITQAMDSLTDHMLGRYKNPGKGIIKHAEYLHTYDEIKDGLERLLEMDCDLTSDIEGFSLKHYDAGIGTITFCWNKHEGMAFPVDIKLRPHAANAPYFEQERNDPVRELLKDFFKRFKHKMIWHNISYDVYVLIYQLFMDDLLDTEGLLDGLDIMLSNWDCTKLISYLATNSCAGNKLGLKYQAQEFAGNYAVEEIEDITQIPLDKLLEYNLVDGLSTWFTHEKHYQTMINDQQQDIYEGLFKDAIVDIVQMQLTGMPIDMDEVKKVQKELQADSDAAVNKLKNSSLVKGFVHELNVEWVAARNEKLKTKVEVMANAKEEFNPNSNPQLQRLLYDKEFLGLPVLDLTDSKAPAAGGKTLAKLINHTQDPAELDLLNALIAFKSVDKILTAFIPAFLKAPRASDGNYYLFGSFNLGGTVSGRLSSSNPNLQNLPASSKYSKAIKRCFKAPKGYIFCGLDFASLEDRISALTTKDPMKLKVYIDGYDGHCLRAYGYFGDKMPDIDPNSVTSINSIAKKYKAERGESKAPTFALTYQGTFSTLMNNCGFSEEKAKMVESKYHEMYKVSDDWVNKKLQDATKDGYITAAFGLRVRTPLLKQVILGNKKTPFEAAAEGRTAGNALGQSWCLLNSRAASEFMKKVRKSKYRLLIRPCAHIHDAQYYMIPDDLGVLMYMNKHLVKAVDWQDHPDIAHPDVGLGGELSIFYPDWSAELELPNGATGPEIRNLANEHYAKWCK